MCVCVCELVAILGDTTTNVCVCVHVCVSELVAILGDTTVGTPEATRKTEYSSQQRPCVSRGPTHRELSKVID